MIRTGDEDLGLDMAHDLMAVRAAIGRVLGRWRRPDTSRRAEVRDRDEGAHPEDARAGAPFAFPIMLDVRSRRVVVVGGGREAANKARALADLGAAVLIWSSVHSETSELIGLRGIELHSGRFAAEWLDGALLAIIASGERNLDRRIAMDARARGVLVNTVDDIPYCDWSAPAILRRGNLTIAVATGGIAPSLAVRLRDRLADEIGPEYADLLEAFGQVRPRITASGRSFADRRRLWYELVDGPALEHLSGARPDAARHAIATTIAAWEASR